MSPEELKIMKRLYRVVCRFTTEPESGCVFCGCGPHQEHRDKCEAEAAEDEGRKIMRQYEGALL